MGLLSRLRARFTQAATGAAKPDAESHRSAAPLPTHKKPEQERPPRYSTPATLDLPGGIAPVMLPGPTPIQIVGESHYHGAIRQAQQTQNLGGEATAVLVADVANPYDQHAVAVYLNGHHAGYLSRGIAALVRPALDRLAAVNGGGLVGCNAEIREHDVGPQIVLYLDVQQLGLSPDVVEELPPIAKRLMSELRRLDEPRLSFSGHSPNGRQLLEEADSYADRVLQMGRGHKRLANEYRRAAEELTKAGDALASRAWLSFARTVRYQEGGGGEAIKGLVAAVYLDRGSRIAWEDLLDYASFLGCVPVLLDIFRRAPEGIRVQLTHALLLVSTGSDRHGHVPPGERPRLREGLLRVAEETGDNQTFSFIAGKYGLDAEKNGDLDGALGYWKQALEAGHISDLAADRYSIWLVKQKQYEDARRVLTQALASPSHRDPVRERMEKRLVRCNKATA